MAALSAEVFALALSVGYLASNNRFGAGDLPAMAIWSLPLSILIYFAFRALLRREHFSSAIARYLVLTLTGALLGIGVTLFAALILGGWFFAFSFPVLFCWVFAGALAGITASLLSAPSRWPIAVVLVVLALLGFTRLNSWATAPEPQIRVTLTPGLSSQDEQRFWSVIETPGSTERGLIDGVIAGSVGGHQNGSAIFVVTLRRHLPERHIESVLARIRRSPLVKDASLIGPN